ncbi:MAG: DNA methyltransferase, partial [Planctomycetota bacterium]
HLKLSLLLKELGYKFKSDERINIYLTNSLEEAMKKSQVFFARFISEEANTAAAIKKDLPIMVVLGNPPYSGHSANRSYKEMNIQKGKEYEKYVSGHWIKKVAKKNLKLKIPTFIGRLIDDYKYVEGAPLGEKNPKWLQDDYVKFIRFAQWRIEKTGYGIVGYISNHAYLDNPTFRGMRQSLMKTFDRIDILDLHGNARKKEVCPDGSKDENVFDIQQGVAIGIFTRLKEHTGKCRVRHGDLWGTRIAKQKTLMGLSPNSKMLKKINTSSPSYYFIRRNTSLAKEYEAGWKITDIMEVNSVGIVTSRDSLVFGFNAEELQEKIKRFADLSISATNVKAEFGLCNKANWNISDIRKQIAKIDWRKSITHCLYRPFDIRALCYNKLLIERSRQNVMRHMLAEENLGLCVGRAGHVVGDTEWNILFCSKQVTDLNLFYRGGNITCPLYLYTEKENNNNNVGGGGGSNQGMMVFEPPAKYGARRANLNRDFVRELEAKLKMRFVETGKGDLKKTLGPEDVFHYIYAIFHSPTYRQRYAEFLKSDFPRVPLTSQKPLFKKLASLGEELVALHLMESPKLDGFITAYNVPGDNLVEKVRYVDNKKRVYINTEQYFDGVPRDVWEFCVGGYQVCEKWLKDRKGRKLAFDDIRHYQRIVVALNETIRLMQDIDKAVPKRPID